MDRLNTGKYLYQSTQLDSGGLSNLFCGCVFSELVHVNCSLEGLAGFFPSGLASLHSSEVKASACNEGDLGSIPGSGRSPGEGNGNPLQYSCLENPMDGGAWWVYSQSLGYYKLDKQKNTS